MPDDCFLIGTAKQLVSDPWENINLSKPYFKAMGRTTSISASMAKKELSNRRVGIRPSTLTVIKRSGHWRKLLESDHMIQ